MAGEGLEMRYFIAAVLIVLSVAGTLAASYALIEIHREWYGFAVYLWGAIIALVGAIGAVVVVNKGRY